MLNAKQLNSEVGISTVNKISRSIGSERDSSEIDTSEIPELTDEDWKHSKIGLYYRPNYKIREVSS